MSLTRSNSFSQKVTVANGTTTTVPMVTTSVPFVVSAVPLNGDTLTVTFSCDDGANYVAWPAGTAGAVTAAASVSFEYPITQLKIACSGSGTASYIVVA